MDNISKKKAPDEFTGEFYEIFKEKIIPILHNPFQRNVAEGMHPHSFYEASITVIPNIDKDIIRKL